MNEVSINNRIASQPEPAEVVADQGRTREAREGLPTIDRLPNAEIRVGDRGTRAATVRGTTSGPGESRTAGLILKRA
jgi:hypothetical protein